MNLRKVLWDRWKAVAQKVGDFQARLLLSIFYFVVLGPFALGVKVLSDPLRVRASSRPSWIPRPGAESDAATVARRQF